MFAPDIVRLKQFYASPLGQAAQSLIEAALARRWPEAKGETIVGVGCAHFALARYVGADNTVMAAMPGWMGAVYWPPAGNNLSVLAHEADLPVPGAVANRMLVLHALEHTESLHAMLEEAHRVLTPGGRLMAVVPNRTSLWARASRTPFGYGRPFSAAQLRHVLEESDFSVLRVEHALMIPPASWRWLLRASRMIEKLGRPLLCWFGGVLIVEAEKQVYAAIRERVRAPVRQMAGLAQPALQRRLFRNRIQHDGFGQ